MNFPEHPHRTWRVWGVTFDWRITQLIGLGTLLLLVDFYRPFLPLAYNRLVMEFAVPAVLVVAFWHEGLREYGLRLGDWRLGLPLVIAAIGVMAAVIGVLGRRPEFADYYRGLLLGRPAWRLVIDEAFELFAWEFFCRGWLLFGLARKYGTDAIWLQTMAFALMHLFKPEVEVLSTVIGGVLFGLLAWRTRSMVYGWLIHWFMAAWMLLVAGGFV